MSQRPSPVKQRPNSSMLFHAQLLRVAVESSKTLKRVTSSALRSMIWAQTCWKELCRAKVQLSSVNACKCCTTSPKPDSTLLSPPAHHKQNWQKSCDSGLSAHGMGSHRSCRRRCDLRGKVWLTIPGACKRHGESPHVPFHYPLLIELTAKIDVTKGKTRVGARLPNRPQV